MHLPFTKELRMIQEVQRVAGDVNYLTINHLQLLLTIYDMETAEGLLATQLADVTGHHKSTVNRIVHSLGAKRGRGKDKAAGLNLIEVRIDPEDERIRRIFVTPYGRRLKKLLLDVGGKDDEEAKAMADHMSAVAFQSKPSVHHVMKIEDVVTAAPEVGSPTMIVMKAETGEFNVTGQDAAINVERASEGIAGLLSEEAKQELTLRSDPVLSGKQQSSLERQLKNAAAKGLKAIKYRGVEVPLIDIGLAQKMVKDGKLWKDTLFGAWAYYENPVGSDYAALPDFIQEDLSQWEMEKFADNLLQIMTRDDVDVVTSLDGVGATLNDHQRVWVVNYIVRGLGTKRRDALLQAERDLDEAEKHVDKQKRAASEAEVHANMRNASLWNPNKEQMHHNLMAKAAIDAVEEGTKADHHIKAAQEKRQRAQKMADLEKQMAALNAKFEELKDED